MNSFDEMGIPSAIIQQLAKSNISVPTPVQAQVVPLALSGRDVVGSAQTGTGKTLAFAIPLVSKLIENINAGLSLVIVPTRELAQQVKHEIAKLLHGSLIKVAVLIGGEPIYGQIKLLRNKPKIIIGTPGRIIDHISRKTLITQSINTLVIDEADRIFDMGFGVQVKEIIECIPCSRQTFMFSATFPDNIVSLAKKYLNDPEFIFVDGESNSAPAKVEQKVIYTPESKKYGTLIKQLDQSDGSVIIFTKTKLKADHLAQSLRRDGCHALAIHGDLNQRKREQVISSFRKGNSKIMVATDIASRGIDIPHIKYVINYDTPQSQDDYIHRIGRTARAGTEGFALCLITPQDNSRLSVSQDKDGYVTFNYFGKSKVSKNFTRQAKTKPGIKFHKGKVGSNARKYVAAQG